MKNFATFGTLELYTSMLILIPIVHIFSIETGFTNLAVKTVIACVYGHVVLQPGFRHVDPRAYIALIKIF